MITLLVIISSLLAGDGKVGGLAFFNYRYDGADDAALKQSFGLTRVYFSYEKELSEGLQYKFQTDIDYGHSPMNLYLKNAKVDWKGGFGKLTFGLQGMNVFNIQEKTWGRRFIEKSAMDKYKFSSSADMGVGYSNKLRENLHLSILYTNGSGYKKGETDKYKKLSTQVLLGESKLAKKEGFNVGGVFSYEPYDVDSINTKTKTVMGIFGGLSKGSLRLGGDFDLLNDTGEDLKKQIISVYTNYQINEKMAVFGRVDQYDPNTGVTKDAHLFLIAGFDYSPGKGLIIAPNLQYKLPEDGDGSYVLLINFLFKI
jgi:hypothetical protein